MLLADIYHKLWQAIGGRPWTYILRDIRHKYEGLCIIALVAVGAVPGLMPIKIDWSGYQ